MAAQHRLRLVPAAVAAGLGQAVSDGLLIAGRNLRRVPRIPELAIFAILQSIMFVLLFAFVFGGAIPLPGGGSYREFLMPGIFAQTVVFAAVTTAIGMTEDVNKGIMDRFRSLPMARSAVLIGRTVFDLVYQAVILVVLMLSGLAVGWRVHGGLGDFVARRRAAPRSSPSRCPGSACGWGWRSGRSSRRSRSASPSSSR